jgi:hypothetical protein
LFSLPPSLLFSLLILFSLSQSYRHSLTQRWCAVS